MSDLKADFERLGLKAGDTVLVHSNMTSFGRKVKAETIRDVLLDIIGPSGTLIVPTFNFQFCQSGVYDIQDTPSKMGVLSELIRLDPRSKRVNHPIYSFAAVGRYSDQLGGLTYQSAYGKDSVFGELCRLQGKIMIIGLPWNNSWTFSHHIEEMAEVEYRHHKIFPGTIHNGTQPRTGEWSMFVRNDGIITQVEPMGKYLERCGLVTLGNVGRAEVKLMDAARVFEAASQQMKAQPKMMYQAYPVANTKRKQFEAKGIVSALFPLHRTLNAAETDTALAMVGDYLPGEANYTVESYPPGQQVWTWKVPERWQVDGAYLEDEQGRRVIDFADNPLHLVSYSLPVDKWLTWDELEPHLYYSAKRPDAIPWEFKFYERNWGFCLPKIVFDELDRNLKYHAVIKSNFLDGTENGMQVGAGVLHPLEGPAGRGEIMLMAHICHPAQANDDLSGVAVIIEVMNRLAKNPLPPGSLSVRFLFAPETIGSIAYLANNEDIIPSLKAGVFVEMAGNDNSIVLQRSRQDNALIDCVAKKGLNTHHFYWRQGAFRDVIVNDEMVLNGPGVDVPCISLSRWPYLEYHSSDDNPDIISEKALQGMADVAEEIVRIYAADRRPRRTFRGPIFLSRYGLWIDWRENPELNKSLDKLMMLLEGDKTVFEIAEVLQLDYQVVLDYLNRFYEHGLIEWI